MAIEGEMANARAFPNATNTGVPARVTLTLRNGDVTVTTPGAVIEGLKIHGSVFINADNVTLRNCHIVSSGYNVIVVESGRTGTTITDCEIDGTGAGPQGQSGILGQGIFLRNNIHHVENGIAVDGNGTVIQDNYIHQLQASGDPHYDGVQIGGALSDITIRHNTVINPHTQTATVYITNDWGSINGVIVDGNKLIGAGFTVYSDEKGGGSGPQITGVQFTNNYLGKGYWGYAYISNNAIVWQGNIDVPTGRTVTQDGILSQSSGRRPPTGR